MSLFNVTAEANNPHFAGRHASATVLFGECSRFALFAVHGRFDAVQWFVTDAERQDELGFPLVIRQAASPAEAVAGLQ